MLFGACDRFEVDKVFELYAEELKLRSPTLCGQNISKSSIQTWVSGNFMESGWRLRRPLTPKLDHCDKLVEVQVEV